MDVLWYWRYQRDGGKSNLFAWEFSAACPAGKRHRCQDRSIGASLKASSKKSFPQRARLVSNTTHWAHAMVNGALYGIAAQSLRQPRA